MLNTVKMIYSILNYEEKKRFGIIVLTSVMVAIIDVIGIASIMPFMAVVSNPKVINTNKYLNYIYKQLNFNTDNSFLVFLGFAVFTIMLLSNLFKTLSLWLELNFIHISVHNFSKRLLYRYLNQPYSFYLNQNTAILGKNILTEVFQTTHNVIKPCIQILSLTIVVTFVLGLLFFVDPVLAVAIFTTLGSAYYVIYSLGQKKMKQLGDERFEANAQRFKAAGEVFGGIKDLMVLRRQRYFFDKVSQCSFKIEKNMITNGLIAQLPRYFMETLSFGGILIIVIYYLIVRQKIGQTLPVIALYTFAGYRLMPAMQGIFSAATTAQFNISSLTAIHKELAKVLNVPDSWQKEVVCVLPFKFNIQLLNMSFAYNGTNTPVINNINLCIVKNTSVGFVGPTGSGKTTIVDIILGLLFAQKGQLLIDDVPVTINNVTKWQRNIGYVPQNIFLSDDSLASNIAFGVPSDEVDMLAVTKAATIANLHEFVVNELPQGYDTVVGERGIRLSGGQRQRIGIARALYHDPEVLIMDEATSALDGITEEAVIQAIKQLTGKKTIITIAHRLTTLIDCDVIYVMDKGSIVEKGTYSELFEHSSRFRAMGKSISKTVTL